MDRRNLIRHNARAATALLCFAAGVACAAPLPPDELFKLVSPAVWRVVTTAQDGRPLASGSAVVIAPETLVTNCHVLRRASSISIRQRNTTHRARLLHADAERDLCELRVPDLKVPPVAIATGPARVGQRVYTIGTPRGLEATLSDGLVSGIRPDARGGGYIQISAPISPGSSGGGLFDEEGRLLGITTSGVAGVAQNLNFARPASLIAEIPERSRAALQRWRAAQAVGGQPSGGEPSSGPPLASIEPLLPPRSSTSPPARAPAPSGPQPPRIASGFAAIDDVDAIPYLNDRGRDGYRRWLGLSTPRAFALANNGRWAASSGLRTSGSEAPSDPSDRALANCERVAGMPCKLYAVNNAVVWARDAAPQPNPSPEATAPARP